jgi:hypothetical protein
MAVCLVHSPNVPTPPYSVICSCTVSPP